MRYSEIAALPGTPDETKNAILDIITVYQAKNQTEIPLTVILKTLHRQNYDVDRRLVIDLIKDMDVVKRISSNVVYLQTDDSDDVAGKDEAEKSKDTVKQMAKKTLKKEAGE